MRPAGESVQAATIANERRASIRCLARLRMLDAPAAEPFVVAMEFAYLHVVINHLPIMGVPIALALLLLGVWARDDAIKRAALLSFVAIGAITIAVFATGKEGEDFVEHVAGVDEDAIERHEDMATIAFAAVEVLAVLSLILFFVSGGAAMLRRRPAAPEARFPALGIVVVFLVALVTSAILGYTGRLGGKISHTEFTEGAAVEEDDRDDDGGRQRRRRRGRG